MIFVVLFILSFTLTYFIKNYAVKKSLMAEVNERSSHSIPTPHGGGIAVAITWFLGLVCLYLDDIIEPKLFFALIIGAVIAMVGLVDDIVELGARTRMVAFALVGATGLYIIGGLDTLSMGVFDISNPLVTTLFAMLLILWYINLTNFIDGINGYLGSEIVFLSIAGFVIFGEAHFVLLAVAVLGFLCWNFGRAKIFMGDSGSTLLGYTVAIFTIYYANIEPSNLWVWVVLFSLFWLDATYTLVLRFVNKEKLSIPHRKHIYQRLIRSGYSHNRVVLLGVMYNLSLFLVLQISLLLGFIWMLMMFFVLAYFTQKRLAFRDA